MLSQQNDRRYSVRYRILVKDDAQDSSSRGEIFIVKDVRSLDPADLAAVHMAYNSFDFVQLGSENEFELAAKSLCHFLLCYQAFPKPHDYPENSGNVENVGNVGNVGNAGNAENIKVRHNAERFVTITLQNDANGLVETVHRLKIVLLPDPGVCEF